MKSRIASLLRFQEPKTEPRGLLFGSGATVPSSADGWQASAIFQDTTNGILYVNEGSITSSDFNPVGTNLTTGLIITGVATRAIDIVTSGVFRMGVQETGIPLTTTYPFAIEVQCEANSDITAGATGSSAGIYSRYAIEFDQTQQCNHIAMFGKLRVKKDLADGNHVAIYGYVEISASGTVIGGTSSTTTAAGLFAIEADTNFELTTGHLNGILIDSSVHASATITGTMAGMRLKVSSGKKVWPTGIQFEAGSATSCIDIACATTPNSTRTNHGFIMGGRSTDELTVTFAGGAGAENYEPVALNFNLVGTNPASTSTINIIQQGLYHDTNDMANLRLKCADWWVTVDKDCKDVYCIQNEINFGSGTNTASGEVSVLGLVLDGGAGTLTCPYYHGVNITLRGAGTPANATGLFIRVESGATVANGIELRAEGTMTAGIRCGNISGGESPTNLLAVPTAGTAPTVAAATGAGTAAEGSIAILVGGSTKYLQYFAATS